MNGYERWLNRMLGLVYIGGTASLIITAMNLIAIQNRIQRKARP